jgi:hypothetical protein
MKKGDVVLDTKSSYCRSRKILISAEFISSVSSWSTRSVSKNLMAFSFRPSRLSLL